MDLNASRLRAGELLTGLGAVLLLVLLLFTHWYASRTGWQLLSSLRWLALVTIVAALALVFLQVTRRAPAVPVTMSVIVFVLGLVTVLWLIYRVVIDPATHEHAGAWLGLLSACLIVIGSFLSMRQEGILPADGPQDIPVVQLRGGGPAG